MKTINGYSPCSTMK